MSIQTSRMVIPSNLHIQNKFGKYWNNISGIIMGHHELRARSGDFSSPWTASSCEFSTMPILKHISDRLFDIFDQRALELNDMAKKQNKHIVIQWSGGIDSTAVVVAFIKNLPIADLTNISIALSTDSVLENPDFYYKFIKNSIKCIPYASVVVNDEFLNNNILLHGDPADCIFGPSVSMFASLIDSGMHRAPFKDNIGLIASTIESNPRINEMGVQGFGAWYTNKVTENLLQVAPDDVTTISDWWWWHYFNLKWEFSIARPLFRNRPSPHNQSTISATNLEDLYANCFYGSDKFQLWSYSNLNNHISGDVSTHKLLTKQYIYQLHQDDTYLSLKKKIESVTTAVAMTSNGMIGYFDREWRHCGFDKNIVDLLESYTG